MTNMVGGKEAEVERLQAYKQMFDHAIACIDRVFQKCEENPHPILPNFCRLGADKFEAVILLAQEFVKVREENERLRAELAAEKAEAGRLHDAWDWIRNKLGLPENATDSDIYGEMHVLEAHAHGYETYIQAHKCDDKQGEIARLTVRVGELEAEIAACRDEVERWQQLARAQSQAIQAAKAECERLRVFERAMESMAAQMIHPKMTALEMANMQLEEPTS